VDMIRKLRDRGDGTGYTATGLLLVEWDNQVPSGPPPTVRARPDLVPGDIAPSRFLTDLVQHVLEVNPIAHHVRVRSLLERRAILVPEADRAER
jgi:hypothetical protein